MVLTRIFKYALFTCEYRLIVKSVRIGGFKWYENMCVKLPNIAQKLNIDVCVTKKERKWNNYGIL